MQFLYTKTGILTIGLIAVFAFLYFFTGVFGETRIGVSLRTNPDLQNGLVAHYTFDGEYEQGTFEFGTGGATTTDPTPNDETPYAITVDNSGYVYVTGTCNGCGSGSFYDYYTYKIDPLSGDMVWATTTEPTNQEDIPYGITTDENGDIYVTGMAGQTAGSNCLFVDCYHYTVKIDGANGDMIWATTTDPSSNGEAAYAITTDNAGNVYVTGTVNITYASDYANYTYKIDGANGDMIWATTTDPTSSSDTPFAIATGADGNLYVTGYCNGCGSAGSYAHYTYKIDSSNGDMLWATSTDPGNGTDEARGIATDSSGNVYVTGTCASGCGNNGTHYTYKIDGANGDMIWATSTDPTSYSEEADAIAIDSEGYVYVTGYAVFGGGSNIVHYTYKIDPSNGDMLWATSTDASDGNDTGESIAVGSSGYVYVTGKTDNNTCGGSGTDTCHYTYKLDPSDGSFVDTTSANAIASVGAQEVPGNIGQGLEFDGVDDYVLVPENTDFQNDFSIAFWINSDDPSVSHLVMGKTPTSDAEEWTIKTETTGIIRFGSQNACSGTFDFIDTLAPLNKGEWTHVVVTMDRGTRKEIFRDGVYNSGSTGGTSILDCDIDFWIGTNERWQGSGNFDGRLDDVRIYNRVLSASEILRLHDLGATTKIAKTIDTNPDLKDGLVGHWTFDGPDMDIASNTAEVLDRSGNGYNGDWQNHGSTTAAGVIGQAISLDGVLDNVKLPEISFSNGTEWTLSAWMFDVHDDGGGNNGNWIGFEGVDKAFGIRNGQYAYDEHSATWISYKSASTYKNKWTHHLYRCNGDGTIDVFLNNEYITTMNLTSTFFILENFGHAYYQAGTSEAEVSLDDVRIYNKALSTSTIKRLYELGATTKIAKTIDTNPDLKDGLLTHYTFDGAGSYNVFSDSGSLGNDAYIGRTDGISMSTTTHLGAVGQGILMDGENVSYISADTADNLTEFTVCTWLNITSFASPGGNTGYVDLLDKFGWRLRVDSSGVNLGRVELQIQTSGSYAEATSATRVNEKEWNHICAQSDGINTGSNPRMFINGVSEGGGFDGDGAQDSDSSYSLIIGADIQDYYAWNLFGALDDIRIYDRVLSDDEISRLYQLGQ